MAKSFIKERCARRLLGVIILVATICSGALAADLNNGLHKSPEQPMITTRLLTNYGGRVDWSRDNRIAFDKLIGGCRKGRYEVFSTKPDGVGVMCVTCERDGLGLPHGWIGQPAWHPSNRFLVVQAEKEHHPKVAVKAAISPGAGAFNDLWLVDPNASARATLLREIPNKKGYAVLHPHFSPDGTKLSWTEMWKGVSFREKGGLFGYWRLMIADFIPLRDTGRLTNIREIEPNGLGWYENHGFSPDGKLLIYTHNTECGDPLSTSNIYTMDVDTGKCEQQLTDSGYNEHGSFSPDGKRIAWMSSSGSGAKYGAGTDFWIMNADGGNKRRLTFFNQKGHQQSVRKKAIAADLSWSPDGKEIAGYVQVVSVPYQERIYIIDVPVE